MPRPGTLPDPPQPASTDYFGTDQINRGVPTRTRDAGIGPDGYRFWRPEVTAFDEETDTLLDYDAVAQPDGSFNLLYVGQAPCGSSPAAAVWKIKKFIYAGGGSNITGVKWADGAPDSTRVWNSRASYSY